MGGEEGWPSVNTIQKTLGGALRGGALRAREAGATKVMIDLLAMEIWRKNEIEGGETLNRESKRMRKEKE